MPHPLINQLGLSPHPEGGAFREVWRAPATIHHPRTGEPRNASTAIYFLLEGGDFSAFHEVASDELWILLSGGPLWLHRITPEGLHVPMTLHVGNDQDAGLHLQVVPAGDLQAAAPAPGASFALCCCLVAPGFDFADFRMPSREELFERFPSLHEIVMAYTRPTPS